MAETVAILLLAIACYLVIRRMPLSAHATAEARAQSKVAEKLAHQEKIDQILSEVSPLATAAVAPGAIADEASEPTVIEPEPPVVPQFAPEVEALLEEADGAFDRGDLDTAERTYVKICAIEPKISHIYARLGAIYLKRDNLEDAKEALEAGLRFEPMHGQILNNLGLVYFKQSKFTDSIRYYERSVRAERGIAARHLNLGLAYMSLRQYHKAAQQFKRASNIEPQKEEFKKLVVEAQEKYAESRVGISSR